MITVNYHDDLKEVQADGPLLALVTSPAQSAPFDRLEWWQGLERDCGVTPLLAVARDASGIAVLPLARTANGLSALANWYNFTTRALVSPGAAALPLLTAIARDLRKKTGHITLAPLPDEGGEATLLAKAFKAAGWYVTLEASDNNHIIHLAGQSYADYLAARPGQLRTTLKRKAKKVEVALHTVFDEKAWAQYEEIYGQSWKPSEGSPAFLRQFAVEEGAAGRLRLAVATAEGRAVAAQLWTVEAQTAFIHKLAYVEDAKPLSPGTTLSAALSEQVIDRDGVTCIDFGTGNDPYKRDWMEAERVRYRLTALAPNAPSQWPRIAKSVLRRLAKGQSRG